MQRGDVSTFAASVKSARERAAGSAMFAKAVGGCRVWPRAGGTRSAMPAKPAAASDILVIRMVARTSAPARPVNVRARQMFGRWNRRKKQPRSRERPGLRSAARAVWQITDNLAGAPSFRRG